MNNILKVILTLFLFVNVLFGQNGQVTGYVLDEENLNLISANVYIQSIGKGAITNSSGKYLISNLPSGTYELTFSYIGFQTKKIKTIVKAGSVSELNVVLNSGVMFDNEIHVLGNRLKGQAKALNQQKAKSNISNIISSDQMGRFPDANIADALKRVSAISVYYDLGEAKFANIRGTEPRLNSVTINGERVPSAEGQTRSIQLDFFPSDMIQTIEVYKALTPDMDADAIGGTVNLVTKLAPNKLRVSVNLGSNYNLLSDKFAPVGNFTIGNRYLNGMLGVILTGSYFDHNLGADNIEADWNLNNGNFVPSDIQVRDYKTRRLRRSLGINLDFIINANHVIYYRGLYNHRNDWENRYRLRYKKIKADGNGNYTAEVRRQTKGGISDNDNARLEQQIMWTNSLTGEHHLGSVNLNWAVSYSKASEDRPNERYIEWRAKKVPITLNLNNLREPKANDNLDYTDFSLREITEEHQFTQEKDFNAKIDIQIPINLFDKGNLKIGTRLRNKIKNRSNNYFEYTPINDPSSILEFTNADYSNLNYLAGNYNIGRFTTISQLGSLKLNNSSLFSKESIPSEFAALNYNAEENIFAGYLMLNQYLSDKIKLIVGARVEKTNIDYSGFKFDEDSESLISIGGTNDYYNFLPGIHLKYISSENSILRLAWTNTIARPNYYDLVPFKYMAKDFEELILGNPELKATTSMNVDLMYESYLESVGLFSIGIFYKNIKNFIYTHFQQNYFDSETGNTFDDFLQPRNGARASLFGVEVGFQKRLDFLPGLLNKLNFYTNYTFTNSTASNPMLDSQVGYKKHISLPGSSPHMFNANLNYQDEYFTLGVSLNYTSEYLDPEELNITPGLERYYDAVTYLDANASYIISKNILIFFEANNLLNQPLRFYTGQIDVTAQSEFYNVRFNGGIKYNL